MVGAIIISPGKIYNDLTVIHKALVGFQLIFVCSQFVVTVCTSEVYSIQFSYNYMILERKGKGNDTGSGCDENKGEEQGRKHDRID